MNSNKQGTMEQNEEHLMVNILTYYMHETVQYPMRYDAMNMGT